MQSLSFRHPVLSSLRIRSLSRKPAERAVRAFAGLASSDESIEKERKKKQREQMIGVPVTLNMSDLPQDGEVLTEWEMVCNPEERTCKALRFVYEEVCPACNGSGTTVSKAGRSRKGRGKRTVGACLRCAGVGYLRHVTSRYQPECNGSLQGPTSLFRPKPENGATPPSENGAKPPIGGLAWTEKGAKPPTTNGKKPETGNGAN